MGHPHFFSVNSYDYNTYHLPNLSENIFFFSGHSNTFAGFQAAGQDTHGSADTNYTASVPALKITSPADQSTVSGTVDVQGRVKGAFSKVEFYVDWNLQQTTYSSPFSFPWNTSGVTAGQHTVAAMAYNTEGIQTCYAIWLQVP
jgi:hypothetical protein